MRGRIDAVLGGGQGLMVGLRRGWRFYVPLVRINIWESLASLRDVAARYRALRSVQFIELQSAATACVV